jgi:glycine oxidase
VTIVVVGGGIVGCSIAYELASRGARVQVVEPRDAGKGATHASAGTLAPYIESHSLAERLSGVPRSLAERPGGIPRSLAERLDGVPPSSFRQLCVRSLAMFDGFIERVSRDARAEIEYQRSGTLQVARNSSESAELARLAQDLGNAGVDCEHVDACGARTLEGGLGEVSGALLIPEHGYVAAQVLTCALKQAAINLGAVWSTTRATAVGPSAHGVVVQTPGGPLAADAVVIAAGSWSSAFRDQSIETGTPVEPVRPIRGQLVQLRLDEPPARRVIWGKDCYLVPWRDGSVLVGATTEDVGFDESSTPEAVRTLVMAAAELVPAVRGARVQEVRVGLRPKTADGLPAIGPSSTMPGVFYATGHYRTGVLLAPLTASLIADLLIASREQPELAYLRPARLGL